MLDGESWKAKIATLAREIGAGWRQLEGVSWKARIAQSVGEVAVGEVAVGEVAVGEVAVGEVVGLWISRCCIGTSGTMPCLVRVTVRMTVRSQVALQAALESSRSTSHGICKGYSSVPWIAALTKRVCTPDSRGFASPGQWVAV